MHIARAEGVAITMKESGFSVFVPHTMSQGWEAYEMDADPRNTLTYEDWIDMDLEFISRTDLIVMVPGWENSSGSKKEMIRSIELGRIPFFAYEVSNEI